MHVESAQRRRQAGDVSELTVTLPHGHNAKNLANSYEGQEGLLVQL